MTKVNEVAVEAARKRKKGDTYTTNVYIMKFSLMIMRDKIISKP